MTMAKSLDVLPGLKDTFGGCAKIFWCASMRSVSRRACVHYGHIHSWTKRPKRTLRTIADIDSWLSHTGPDGSTPEDRIAATGYLERIHTIQGTVEYRYRIGENLARGQQSTDEALWGWMRSPGHRENILNPEFEETGIGIIRDCWVQVFGTVTTG